MISYLKGSVLERGGNYLVLLVGDIGYKVFVTPEILSKNVGSEISLYIYMKVSDDGQSLYGLPSFGDLQFFELLITVSGVGPKGALGIMSSAKRELIEQAISSQDSLMFTKIGGIGKKTAERIIVELKNKVSSLGATSLDSATGDLMEGLMALGYKQQEIMNVLPKIDSSLSMEAKLKMALKMLSKK
jgi:Holliday junction DNA helicase RuvA